MKEQGNIRVLIVDDNESMQVLTKTILKKCDYIADVAVNGEDMVRKYDQNEYDILLVDLQMPVMDGIEATSIIRRKELDNNKKTPIIAVTGSEILLEHQARKLGFDACLPKPYSREKLLEVVKRFC
ncbi:response regulator [candidate division KSB1 bacterium]